MRPPGNILYIIQGEMSILLTAMRRGPRWSGYSSQDEGQDSLLKAFAELKVILSHTEQWDDLDPGTVISPFLNVIRDNDTPGPVTGLALGAVNKLLSYHVIDPSLESAPAVMESIADAVTHARFVGTETSSDEVVLVKILQVLRTLLMIPAGYLLSNESVCEIMQSCFRLCFEPRLSELLRRSAEHILTDLTQLLFTRLADMSEDDQSTSISRKLKMRSGGMDGRGKKKGKFPRLKYRRRQTDPKESGKEQSKDVSGGAKKPDSLAVEPAASETQTAADDNQLLQPGTTSDRAPLATTPGAPKGAVVDLNHLDRVHVPETVREAAEEGPPVVPPSEGLCDPPVVAEDAESVTEETGDAGSVGDAAQMEDSLTAEQLPTATSAESDAPTSEAGEAAAAVEGEVPSDAVSLSGASAEPPADETEDDLRENPQGVKFTGRGRGSGPMVPYGLPCVREVLNFFASLTCPQDRNNSDFMIHCGLGLLAVAMETGADQMARLPSLIALVRDEICRNLFSLLNSERLSIFSAALRCCLLLFESLRGQAKFQLEMYLTRLTDIIVSENPRMAYEQKEMALDALVQLWKVPGLVTELYLNYDCDPYCSNLFEDVTKLLSKNAFPVQGVYSTHLLSLDALLTVVDSIEHQCHTRIHSELRPRPEASPGDASASPSGESFTFPASGYLIGCSQPRTPPPSDVAAGHWPSRRPPVDHSLVPTHEELMAVKHKKKLLASGTEHFNIKPAKGIQFLQNNGLLSSPLDPKEVVNFIKENPRLDKKMIGEYISSRKNLAVLEAFVKSFDFAGLRVDESLRLYLEAFRLPGEAPVISLLMEHFADHWHKSNDEPFTNADAAFTLAYAIIMLNVDQHNNNVRKNTVIMTRDDFKRNLKKVNGGSDFNQEMLDEIYAAIKSDEIVMPAEQTGNIRENYLWKVLLRRGAGRDGKFVRARSGTFDHDLFSLSWGPTVAALSFVFDRSSDEMIVQKAIGGFRKCAMIAAHYGMSDVYDNLVISLCKFTTLGTSSETPENLVISFGANTKAQLAARTVFTLTHRHGDILRDGWRNLLDCLLQLYRCRLLSTEVTEAEDFLSPTGRVSLFREPAAVTQRAETSLLSSLYSYIALGAAESPSARQPTPEDQENKARAQRVVRECQPEQLMTESKFLRVDSLQELVKALILASHGPDGPVQGSSFDEDSASFFLEILIKVVIQNRDRAAPLWQSVRNHIYSVVMSASASHHNQLMERGIVGLIRLVIRLVRREELTCQVLQSLRMLLLLRGSCLQLVCRQAAAGLHELLRTAAGSVTTTADWAVLFTLLECVGAGARPPAVMAGHTGGEAAGASDADPGTASDGTADSGHASDKCYSDSELYENRGQQQSAGSGGRLQSAAPFHSMSDLTAPRGAGGGGASPTDPPRAAGTGGWILVGKEGEIEPLQMRALPLNQFNITHDRDLLFHDPVAFAKSAESLSLLIRDAAHVTAANFAPCVQCLRTYVEASLHGRQQQGNRSSSSSASAASSPSSGRRRRVRRRDEGRHPPATASSREYDADESDSEAELPAGYHQIAIQLLDLMHTLHTRAAHIFGWFGPPSTPTGTGGGLDRKPGQQQGQQGQQGQQQQGQQDGQLVDSLWEAGWCPLLQGIARLCCDSRKQVRASAVTYLQRSLLVHDLQALSPNEWEACFHKVLFPLLAKLLEPSLAAGLEETRMRAATLLCKVFLQHLTPLLSLPTFTALWLTILDFMDKYLQADRADLLHEAIPESMKNMLLVMETAGIFHTADGYTELWAITWDRIDTFLPSLREQVFSNHPPSEINKVSPAAPAGAGQEHKPAGAAAGGGGGGTAVTAAMAPGMREIRPASPLHHEELMTSAPSVILGPPLPAGPSAVTSGVIGERGAPAPAPVLASVPAPFPAPVPAPAPVPLMSLSAQPPAGPVFLQPLPPPGVAAPVPVPTLVPPTPAPAPVLAAPVPVLAAPALTTPSPGVATPVVPVLSASPVSVAPVPSLAAAAAVDPSDVSRPSADAAVTSDGTAGLPVFRMEASEGADDFLSR